MNVRSYAEDIGRDAAYAVRAMYRKPILAVATLITLALGIGANTAVFTVINGVLLKPLPYYEPDKLMRISVDYPERNMVDGNFNLGRFEEMRGARSFSGFAGFLWSPQDITLAGGDPELLRGARVSANFLNVLGTQPAIGRGFLPEEDQRGGPNVAMISASLWRRRFGADLQFPSKTIVLNSVVHTVVGVVPDGVDFPFADIDVWLPRPAEASALPSRYWDIVNLITGVARMKPGVSLEESRTEMKVFDQQYAQAHPGLVAHTRISPLKDQLVANVRPTLWILFGVVIFVLLIACANVASVQVARGAARSGELSARLALGASRGRLVRQLLVESVIISLLGGALGALAGQWTLTGIMHMSGFAMPRTSEIGVDGWVLAFTIGLSILTGILSGLLPALHVSHLNLAGSLRDAGGGAQNSAAPRSILFQPRGILVVGQIALSLVLLIGAALMIRSLARLRDIDLGFTTANLLTMKLALPPGGYDTNAKKTAFFTELLQGVKGVPDVVSATAAMSLPTRVGLFTNIAIKGQPEVEPSRQPQARLQSVTPGYFEVLGIKLRQGRTFTEHDTSSGAPVIVVNESFARRFWPGYPRISPVGQRMFEGADLLTADIVGVVADVRERGPALDAEPQFYLPMNFHPAQTAYLVVRTAGPPLNLVNTMRRQVMTVDRDQPISEVQTIEETISASVGDRQLITMLLGLFASISLLLVAVGIYGVIAYLVLQRTREIGIRMALGAQKFQVVSDILRQGLILAFLGVALGIGGAFALTRFATALLFQVSPTDPLTFLLLSILFILLTLAASYVPARRAAKVDPINALRFFN